jgi:hypothetical protein
MPKGGRAMAGMAGGSGPSGAHTETVVVHDLHELPRPRPSGARFLVAAGLSMALALAALVGFAASNGPSAADEQVRDQPAGPLDPRPSTPTTTAPQTTTSAEPEPDPEAEDPGPIVPAETVPATDPTLSVAPPTPAPPLAPAATTPPEPPGRPIPAGVIVVDGPPPPIGSPLESLFNTWFRAPDGTTFGPALPGSGGAGDLYGASSPDYVAIHRDGTSVAGYARRVDLLDRTSFPEGWPVYDTDRVTLVGHWRTGLDFEPLETE